MADFAREAFERTVAEPYRIKVVEKLRLPERSERERILETAHFCAVYIDSPNVFIDLVTDSGTGAMSDAQWAGLMRGDEAYMQSRSFGSLLDAVREVTGFRELIPTHQGRAAEHILMELLVERDSVVISNTHFDTTRAHVLHRNATPLDLVGEALWQFEQSQPFKGNFDLQKLELALEKHHRRTAMIIVTVVNNFAGSSPVSMANIRAVRALADRFDIPVYFDAARFAENALFIKQREAGYADKSVAEIAREMLSHGHGCWVSAKKDALVNVGGFIATNDAALAQRCRERLVLYEGFPTYGGLAGRDLEAMAVGMHEAVDEDYLAHRVRLLAYLGAAMKQAGAVISEPVGGSGVFVDVAAMYPHLPPERLPSIALSNDYYVEGGIRVGAAPFPMNTVSVETGEIEERVFQFARFALPRRVYTKSHMDYIAEITSQVVKNAARSEGYRVLYHPEVLGHFFAKFAPWRDESAR